MVQIIQYLLGALAPVATLFSPTPTTKQSGPFILSLVSNHTDIDGSFLYACHTGAARNALCAPSKCDVRYILPSTFYFNTSRYFPMFYGEAEGYLTYNMKFYNDDQLISCPTTMSPETTEGYSHPEIFPSSNTTAGRFTFDKFDYLTRVETSTWPILEDFNLDPTNDFALIRYQKWSICTEYSPSSTYTYRTLVWYDGVGSPDVGNCHNVRVKRTFI
ncbi:hypothetical protein OCU04_007037 [Sclerotinia nivalis]|uniref:Uncharacterized protein n=1 Tax=Sclerotinia nivalis TaxID=352851 RepID=A0A9X0AL01_9HELO|nr:hypothetical protein OCU04_007037 [Sclerotinia nivalis]